MRILELRFKNLNSLYGEWTIDFTCPEYVRDGIFVITGPTGAGKSTIMDGICLALYGRTPRLKSISKTVNDIMSRQTGECFAEVVFEAGASRFRVHWSQVRAYKKPDGNLAESKHEISDDVTGKILASKKRDTAARVLAETGMDFDRFTRSMMLAQGGFAAFLQAVPDERAPILEQITGTEIYSQISIKVHERLNEEKDKLKLLEARLGGIQILSQEEEDAVSKALEERKKQEIQIRKQVEALGESLVWLSSMKRLKKEIADLVQAVEDIEKAQVLLGQERVRLKERLEFSHKQLAQAEEYQKAQLVLIKEVRRLDFEIEQNNKVCEDIRQECLTIESRLSEETNARAQAETDLKKKADLSEKIRAYLVEHAADEGLASVLAAVREKIDRLNEALNTCDRLKVQVTGLNQSLKKETAGHQKHQAVCRDIEKRQQSAALETAQITKQMEILLDGRSVKGYRAEYEGLLREMAYKRKIADLETERHQLVAGKACPLCGSLEHPFVQGKIPRPDKIQEKIDQLSRRINQLEELEQKQKAAQEQDRKLIQESTTAQKQAQESAYQIRRLTEETRRSEKELQAFEHKKYELNASVKVSVEPFGIKTHDNEDFKSVCHALEDRVKIWQACQADKSRIEKEIAGLTVRIKQSEGAMSTLTGSLEDRKKALEIRHSKLKTLKENRNARFGLNDPDKEEFRLESAVITARNSEITAAQDKDKAQQQLIMNTARIEDLKKTISQKQSELDEEKFLRLSESPLEEEHKKTQIMLQEIGEALGALKHQRNENSMAKLRIQEQMDHIAAQKKEQSRWEMLHALIGSADGKKYRNFAQGITFELMIAHANRQLEKMSDRYLLVRDEEQPLELNIIDDYQAGEIRSTKNLSGGESFIVSLSLALGLSAMASGKVRVDSLFLDEGFGTLDEDALETALQSLAGLHRSGKLIGVISHVPALKENISARIQITPVSGGKSSISGPGCEKR